jgi:hypothetical protein
MPLRRRKAPNQIAATLLKAEKLSRKLKGRFLTLKNRRANCMALF